MHPDRVPRAKGALSLASLAARAQLGDRGALETLLRALELPLLDHARTIVDDEDLADDVLQESLMRISRALGSLREPEWVRAWAYRITTREAIRAARAERRARHEAIDDWNDFPAADGDVAAEDFLDELPTRLAELPRKAQLVLRMRYLQELSQQEIAEVLEIPLGTVKSRIAYGLSVLRQLMGRGVLSIERVGRRGDAGDAAIAGRASPGVDRQVGDSRWGVMSSRAQHIRILE